METKLIKTLSLILLVTFCNSCKNTPKVSNGKDSIGYLYNNNGYFCRINKSIQDTLKYKIEWGTGSHSQFTNQEFQVQGNGYLNLIGKSRTAFILTQGCGTSCKSIVILPLTKNVAENVYLFAKSIDTGKNLIAYVPDSDSSLINIENYITHSKTEIREDDLCPAAFKGDCIDSCYFQNKYFVYRWNGKNWNSKNPDIKQKRVELKLEK